MNALLALWQGPVSTWGIAGWAAAIVAIAGICALVFVALRAMNIQLPEWFIHVVLIVFVCVIVIAAIHIVAGM